MSNKSVQYAKAVVFGEIFKSNFGKIFLILFAYGNKYMEIVLFNL